MAAITNPERYHIISFDANFALSGGIVFALKKKALETDPDEYYVVSEFQFAAINKRRYPYRGIIEDVEYLFTEDGKTSTELYSLYCVDGIIDSSGGGSGSPGSSGSSGSGVPGAMSFRESIAMQAINAMIQLTPNPLAYKTSTIRLLTQKAFEFSDEFIKQAEIVRDETGETGGEGQEIDKEVFEQFVNTFRDAMYTHHTEEQGGQQVVIYDSILAAVKTALNDALFVTVEEGQGSTAHEVKKSVFALMKDEMVSTMRDIFSTDVSVGSTPVMKSMAELLNEQKQAITAMDTKMSTMNTTLGNIKLDQDTIAAALSGSGSGGGGGIMTLINSISDAIDDMSDEVSDMSTEVGSMSTTVSGLGTDISAISTKVTNIEDSVGLTSQGDMQTLRAKLNGINSDIGTWNGETILGALHDLSNSVGSWNTESTSTILGTLRWITENKIGTWNGWEILGALHDIYNMVRNL